MSHIRVLLVESELEDARFLQDALAEMEESTHGGTWLHTEVIHLERLADARLLIASERPDVILFNPTLPDSNGVETYHGFRDTAPEVPCIALIGPGEEALGRRMLREGAQEYLLNPEIDCDLLARALMNAIERQRFLRSAFRTASTDAETGLPNATAFATLAARDALLAADCSRPLSLLLAEIDNLEEMEEVCGRATMHEMIAQAANAVRSVSGEKALTARVGLGRFAILDWEQTPEQIINNLQRQLQADHQPFAFIFGQHRIECPSEPDIPSAMRAAEQALWENRLACSNLP